MKKKAIHKMKKVFPTEFPFWEVGRFFVEGNRYIDFSNDQASFGEDYGTIDELRGAIEWLVNEFGGEVEWDVKKKTKEKK